jgi:AraC-like DNA-binding protein
VPDDPSFPLSIGLEPPAGPGIYLLGLLTGGRLRLITPGSSLLLATGTLFLVPPGTACRFAREPETRASGVRFPRSLVDPLLLDSALTAAVELLAAASPRTIRLHGHEVEEAAAVFSWLEREARAVRPAAAMTRLKIMEAILLAARGETPQDAGGATGSRAVMRFHPEEALQFVRDHCTDPLTLPGLASRYGLNPSYFSRLFHRHAGMPLVEFVNKARVQRSCQLLKRSDASILEVAVAVGYNNLSHFNRCFRRTMGMSPREYRSTSRR